MARRSTVNPTAYNFGMKLIEKVNAEVEIQHPELGITTVDLAELIALPILLDVTNVMSLSSEIIWLTVLLAEPEPAQSSPPFTKKDEIKVGQPFVYESFIGSQFKGVILDTTKVADYDAVIPQITGSAYLTGEATYVIDPDDPLKYGFKVGR